jgi:hypothetical protein
MKRLMVLLLLLIVSTSSVFAEWTHIGEWNVMTIYVDFGAVRKKENNVNIWYLYDFQKAQTSSTPSGEKYLSMLNRNEYDCENETVRLLDFILYSGNMKTGNAFFTERNLKSESTSILPNTLEERLFKVACDKK